MSKTAELGPTTWTKIVKTFNDGTEKTVAMVNSKEPKLLETIQQLSPIVMDEPNMTVTYKEGFKWTADSFLKFNAEKIPNDAEFGEFVRMLISKK